jgi:glycosyltransferase involved in cell wall biosynthesis
MPFELEKTASGTTPLISVVTVCFNSWEALTKTIKSVVSQDFENFEYILVDGGSTDGTIEIIRSFGDRITKWTSEPDRGIYHAMNKGLGLARGKYIHFLNAGDTFLDRRVLSQVALHLADEPSLLMTQVEAVSPSSGARQLFPKSFGHHSSRALFKSIYCHQAAFIERSAYLKAGGFDEGFPHFADFKAICTIRQTSADCVETPFPTVEFPLDGATSDWRRAPRMYKEQERLLAHFNEGAHPLSYWIGLVRAHLYKMKMNLKHRLFLRHQQS